MNEQLLKTSGAAVLSSGKKLRKTLWVDGIRPATSPPPPLLVRPEVNLFLLLVHVLDSFAFRLAHIRVDVF